MITGDHLVLYNKEKYVTEVKIVIIENNSAKFLIELEKQDNGLDYKISLFNFDSTENTAFIPFNNNEITNIFSSFMGNDIVVKLVDDYEKVTEKNHAEFKCVDEGIIVDFSTNIIKIRKMGPNKQVNSQNNIVTRLETVFATLENKHSPKKR